MMFSWLICEEKALSVSPVSFPGRSVESLHRGKGLKTVFKAWWRGKGFRAPFLRPIWLSGCSRLSPSRCMWHCTFCCPCVWRTLPHRESLARALLPLTCLSLTKQNKSHLYERTHKHVLFRKLYLLYCSPLWRCSSGQSRLWRVRPPWRSLYWRRTRTLAE